MARRLIVVEDLLDEETEELNQATELLQQHGFKAYPLSTTFNHPDFRSGVEMDSQLTTEPASMPQDIATLQTLLNQKTLLEDELRRYRILLENSGDVLYALDLGGNISFVTSNVREMLGYEASEILGRNVLDVIPVEFHTLATSAINAQLDPNRTETYLTDVLRKDGTRLPVEISARNYYENDLPVLQIGLVRDISQRKRMEAEMLKTVQELRDANQRLDDATRHKSEFLANMSHELRTPLNAIIGFSEVLYDQTFGPLTDKQRRFVDNILNSGKHLLALVNDVLDLSKVEAGKMKLNLEPIKPHEVINEALLNLQGLAQKKEISLSSVLAPNTPEVQTDRSKLKQILYNIYSNAIKFTPEGGAVETVTRIIQTGDAMFLEIAVKDTGIGIRPEDQERIFEEFQMVDSTLSRKQQGTGLGLALSRKLIQVLGGNITVTSVLGKGSIFVVTLPLQNTPTQSILEWQNQVQRALQKGDGDLVLVVEDDDKSAELLELYIVQSGYKVERSRNGEEALLKARQLHPTLITLDIILPHKNGWDVLRELKADPQTSDIPVLVVSMMDSREICFQLGAVDCFEKPLPREAFMQRIHQLKTEAVHLKRQQHLENHLQQGGLLRALVIDNQTQDALSTGPLLEQAGMQVTSVNSGRSAWEQIVQNPPDLVVLDLVLPDSADFNVLAELRQNPATFDVPVVVFTAKDLNPTERGQLAEQAEAVLHKGSQGNQQLLDEILRLSSSQH